MKILFQPVNILMMILSLSTLTTAQSTPNLPLSLTLSIADSSASPTFAVKLSNTSNRSIPILKPGANGFMNNLVFTVVPYGGDTLFVEVDTTFTRMVGRGGNVQLVNLHSGESISGTVDIFNGGSAPDAFTVTAIYRSVFATPGPRSGNRSSVWHKDVESKRLSYP